MANEEPFGAQGKAFVGKTCLDTTHLGDNLEDCGGTQRHHGSRDGKQSSLRRWRGGDGGDGGEGERGSQGEPGENVAASLSHLLLSCLSERLSQSQCLRTQLAPIPTVSHLLGGPCFWSQLSRTWPVSHILHFCSLASQKGHPHSDRNASHSES